MLTLKALGIGLVPSVPLQIRRKWLEQANVSRYFAFGALGRDIGNRFNLFSSITRATGKEKIKCTICLHDQTLDGTQMSEKRVKKKDLN